MWRVRVSFCLLFRMLTSGKRGNAKLGTRQCTHARSTDGPQIKKLFSIGSLERLNLLRRSLCLLGERLGTCGDSSFIGYQVGASIGSFLSIPSQTV